MSSSSMTRRCAATASWASWYMPRMHQDIEVAHYASTAMSELSRSYELELHHFESHLTRDLRNASPLRLR